MLRSEDAIVPAVAGILLSLLAGCQQAAAPAAQRPPAEPESPPAAEPAASVTCTDSAIRLLDRGAGIHGAIVSDTLHLGGAEAPVTCAAAETRSVASVAGASTGPSDRAASTHQSEYSLIVIRYPAGTRLYILSRRADGTTCLVDTNDACVAEVSRLPDGFEVDDLPDDVPPTIPAGRTIVVEDPAAAPEAAGNPNPRDGATGVTVDAPVLSWTVGVGAVSYDLYWGPGKSLGADAALGTPVHTRYTALTIQRPGTTAADRRLASATTYYWRVDAKNDHGTTRGTVWSFTTTDDPGPPAPAGGGYTPPVVTPAPAAVTISIADASITEGNGRLIETGYTPPVWRTGYTPHLLPVRLSSAMPGTAAFRQVSLVPYRLSEGTATAGDDYGGSATGRLHFLPGYTSETVYFYVVGDLDDEQDETFTVTISPRAPLTCGRCTATITIVNDD